MSAYLLPISTKNFTIFLFKYTEHSTTKVKILIIIYLLFITSISSWLVSIHYRFHIKFFLLVSFYAFFKRWLPLGQLFNIKFYEITLYTKKILRTLAGDEGCFPFDNMAFASYVCLALIYFNYILSFTRFKGAS